MARTDDTAGEQREREEERVRVAIERIKRQRRFMIAGMALVTAAILGYIAVERHSEHRTHDKNEGQH